VRIVRTLLVFESLLLFSLGMLYRVVTGWMPGLVVAWEGMADSWWFSWAYRLLQDTYSIGRDHVALAGVLSLLGGMALIAALALCRLRRSTWLVALSVQGVQLTLALVLYFTTKPAYVSVLMALGVVMVLYLQYSEVVNAFGSRQIEMGRSRRGEPAR
jgi:hypothetical protein